MKSKNLINTKPKKPTGAILAAFVALLMVSLAVVSLTSYQGQTAETASPAVATSSITPSPQMNTNITWSSFNSSWTNPLTYQSGATQANTSILNASLDTTFYRNPISINPANIIAPGTLQQDKYGANDWSNATPINNGFWYQGNPSNETAITSIKEDGEPAIQFNVKTASTWANFSNYYFPISPANMPSNNPAFDYVTITGFASSTKTLTGEYATVWFGNGTAYLDNPYIKVYPGQSFYFTVSLQTLENGHQGAYTNSSSDLQTFVGVYTPQTSTASDMSMTITGMAMTTTPLTLGTHSYNGTIKNLVNSTGSTTLTSFSPDFKYTNLANGGYQAAISQSLQNVTTSQTSISNGQYIEQATFQGYEELPTASDLTYSNTNISMSMQVPGSQYQVANLNGVSFLTSIQALKNGTMNFGTVNPNSQNSLVLEVQFTTTQWNGISSPPSFWSNPVGAIEYYWYVFLGATFAAIGLSKYAGSKMEGFRGVKK